MSDHKEKNTNSENLQNENNASKPDEDIKFKNVDNQEKTNSSQTEEVKSSENTDQNQSDENKDSHQDKSKETTSNNVINSKEESAIKKPEPKSSADDNIETEVKSEDVNIKNREDKVETTDDVETTVTDDNSKPEFAPNTDDTNLDENNSEDESDLDENNSENAEVTDDKKASQDNENSQSDEDEKPREDTVSEADDEDHHKEIDDANAEDSEDHDNASRHDIELKDYDAMSMDELVIEIEKLLKKEKVQAIREHVTQIKIAFDKKFNEVIDEKKEQFIEDGGNVIDFHYSSPVKTKFNRIYFDYREKRDAYYKNLKKNLNENLKSRLSLIEELKNMIGSGRDMKATFNQFKDLQERWKNAGPVPRTEYSQLWKTYHHHVERFYDYLHLDREFRDLDFQYNLDQKLKIIDRAQELVEESNINRAFRELQLLHKMWKEELGPVAREYRDEIWDKFSDATKKIHKNRREHFDKLDKEREKNLDVKLDIIKQIEKLADKEIKSHKEAQRQIKLVNELRELFFKAGRVPQKNNENVWKLFKVQTRRFNRTKNSFYKNLKHEQNENLEKKLELIKIAEDNKDSDDFETVTPLMKKIQADWKKIGFVPRKHSDKIWKQFKAACNYYFDRFHSHKNEENDEEFEAFKAKKNLLDEVKKLKLKGGKKEDLKTVKSYIEKWKSLGSVPQQKRYIEGKFNKALDHLFQNINIDRTEGELLKYENRLQGLEEADDNQQIYKEEQFLRTKINDTKSKINQFENNLQFFSTSDKESPLVKEVYDNIDKLKNELEMWEIKLRKIKSL